MNDPRSVMNTQAYDEMISTGCQGKNDDQHNGRARVRIRIHPISNTKRLENDQWWNQLDWRNSPESPQNARVV
jgi:hypothetical protein